MVSPWCSVHVPGKENYILFHRQIRELVVPKIKFRARKLQLDMWCITQCLQQKNQGFKGLAKAGTPLSSSPTESCGSCSG